jgi:hypothetical protein
MSLELALYTQAHNLSSSNWCTRKTNRKEMDGDTSDCLLLLVFRLPDCFVVLLCSDICRWYKIPLFFSRCGKRFNLVNGTIDLERIFLFPFSKSMHNPVHFRVLESTFFLSPNPRSRKKKKRCDLATAEISKRVTRQT